MGGSVTANLSRFLPSGYACAPGQVLNSIHLEEIIGGLRTNGLLKYSHILTGTRLIPILEADSRTGHCVV